MNFASFDFLNFLGEDSIKKDCERTIRKYGVGSCGPRGFYGTIDVGFSRFLLSDLPFSLLVLVLVWLVGWLIRWWLLRVCSARNAGLMRGCDQVHLELEKELANFMVCAPARPLS